MRWIILLYLLELVLDTPLRRGDCSAAMTVIAE